MATPISALRVPGKVAVILAVAALSLVALAWFGFSVRIRTAPTPYPGTPEQKAAVAEASSAFLAAVDAGDIERTWNEASPLMQKSVSKTSWRLTLSALRAPLGALKERRGVGIGFTHNLGQGPDGDYCAVVYESTFATTGIREQVTMHFDEDRWKVIGYKVKKTLGRL